jgi:allophanate hydrolase subunit 1
MLKDLVPLYRMQKQGLKIERALAVSADSNSFFRVFGYGSIPGLPAMAGMKDEGQGILLLR